MKKFLYLCLAVALSFGFTACSDDDDNEQDLNEIVKNQISILSEGQEIKDGAVVTYHAEVDELFGDVVAGHLTEPAFVTTAPCNMEVTITVPECDIKYIQWCGITHECSNYKSNGTYTRSIENMTAPEAMEMHAYFKPEVHTNCKVKVDVKVNGKQERSFFIEYVY